MTVQKSCITDEFRSAFEYAAIGMAIVSLEGKWLKVNKSICTIVGYTEEELLEIDFQTITHPDFLGEDLEHVRMMLNRQSDYYEMEKKYIHKQGHSVWVLLSVSLVFDPEGKPKYFISQIQDIDARKKAEEMLKNYTNSLEYSNRQLEELVHIVSHDLKEPLRGASYYNSIIAEDCDVNLNSDLKKMLNLQNILLKKMSNLLDHLLYYSKIGFEHLAFKETNMNEIVGSIINNTLKVQIESDKVTIEVLKLPENQKCDFVKMQEVFQNLISNAIKYNRSQNKKIVIGYDSKKKFYYVKDNGIGISDYQKESIYRMFKRGHDYKDLPSGSGVGLPIVKKIVERHEGELWCESSGEDGSGSKFCFTLGNLS